MEGGDGGKGDRGVDGLNPHDNAFTPAAAPFEGETEMAVAGK